MHLRALAQISGLLIALNLTNTQADTPSSAEMWEIIQQQQSEIESLKGSDKTPTGSSGISIGGYGEMHYNNLEDENGTRDKEIDFHRFVLFFGHEFSENIRFFSEVEIEHALSGDGKEGEVELEQAYVEFDINEKLRAKGGVFLLPVGIINETHEPNTFYGVERNPVEKNIIPSTWWAGGAELSVEADNHLSFNVAIHEGLNTSSGDKYAVRKGRQKTSKADAHDLAATGRIKWTGAPGIELAATIQYQENITQGNDDNAGSAMLYEAHAVVERGPFGLRALYALWDLNGSGPSSMGADEQSGFYLEPSYRIRPKMGLFARYNQWDNQAGDSSDSQKKQYDIGLNYWPHPDVVLKLDLQKQDNEGGTGEKEGINLGIGYQF